MARYSCRKDDPGYINWARNTDIKIFLDGLEVSEVFTADEEGGYVMKYKQDTRGSLIINRVTKYCEEEKLYGVVKVV